MVHKRHLFDVYSSMDEEVDDINKLQEEFESETESVSSEEIFGLEVEDTFESWESAERQVESYAKESGFGVRKVRTEKNKEGKIARRTFACKFSGKYRAQKRADVKDTRERSSAKTNCPWNINIRLSGSIVCVTSMCEKHNHPLLGKENPALNHCLSREMLEEVEFLVNVGCEAGPIIRALQKRFPNELIRPKSVYNAICNFRRGHKKQETDAAETFDRLMTLQREEHGWFVKARLEGEDNHLTGLFWMRPSQIELWQKFHDVAINDNTSQTNKYRMYLSLTIVVDNHARSRMAATAVISDETKESYQWILECLLSATNLAPNVIFTDADPAMVAAIHESLPTTKHNYCIWHIRKNLDKNLKGKLHGEYSNFVTAWNKCRNSFSENEFKKKFDELLIKFPAASKYLKRSLGTDVTSWALCYTHRSFNAGIQTTQRVESYNSLIKRSVKSSTTLFELDTQIQLLLDKEEQFERQEEQTSENPISGLPNVVRRYFKRVDDIIKKFLTPRLLKMQHRQMNESLLYRADQIEDWENLVEQFEDNEEQSDEERSDNEEQSDEECSDNEEQSDEECSDNEEQSDEESDNKQSDDEHRQSDDDDEKINRL